MTIVRNNHDSPLTVAGVPIRSGATARVANWSPETADGTERALLTIGKIEVVRPAEPQPKADEKPAAAAQGKAKG